MIKFIGSFDNAESLPRRRMHEYAFVGRSNVGKSSLLNALVGSNAARTSNTPGRTRMIIVFEWDNVFLTDLPGYGYAKAAKSDLIHWNERLTQYLLCRNQLSRLFILIDARRGMGRLDTDLMDFCDDNAIQYQLIVTKTDKVKQSEVSQVKSEIEYSVKNRPACVLPIILTSAEKKQGIDILTKEIKDHSVA